MSQTKHVQGYTITKDNVMIIHPGIEGTIDGGINVPQTDTMYGAGFGDSIGDSDRAFASCREPIAHFLTFIVAADMIEKWFSINDPETEEADPALDRSVQDEFTKLKFKRQLRVAVESARIYGRALLVGGFNDAKAPADLAKPKALGAQLMQLAVYPETYKQQKVKEFAVDSIDVNPVSTRYGQPLTYKLIRQSMNESGQATQDNIIVHWSRVCEVGNGTSVLDKVWDDMGCGRNIRWGAAQWMYRTGSGFPVVGFPSNTTKEQLQTFHESGLFNNLMSRTGIFIAQNSTQENTGMTFEFKGPAGQSLDPTPFYVQNIQQIAIATGYPQAKLIGAQAGAVTGSEVNQQEYYKAISRDQEFYCEEPIRWVLDQLSASGQISIIQSSGTADKKESSLVKQLKRLIKRDYRHKTVSNYSITWNSAFELSDKDEAQIELQHVQANQGKLDYMSKDEVRAADGLDPLPNGAGEWKEQQPLGFSGQLGGQPFKVKTAQKMGNANNEQKPTEPNSNADPSGSSDHR